VCAQAAQLAATLLALREAGVVSAAQLAAAAARAVGGAAPRAAPAAAAAPGGVPLELLMSSPLAQGRRVGISAFAGLRAATAVPVMSLSLDDDAADGEPVT